MIKRYEAEVCVKIKDVACASERVKQTTNQEFEQGLWERVVPELVCCACSRERERERE